MFRIVFFSLLSIHGLIHLLGFAKAFGYGHIEQLTKAISKPQGMMWLLAALLFVLMAVLFVLRKEAWWMLGVAAVLMSQYLIGMSWQDAKFGSIANVLIGLVMLAYFGQWQFKNHYLRDVREGLARTAKLVAPALLTESDLVALPAPVAAYIRLSGAVGQPKLQAIKVVFEGQMRDRDKDWFSFRSEQYNFFDQPTRLFYMEGRIKGLKVPGYHAYKGRTASMQIKPFGFIPVVNVQGTDLFQAETVTLFNDMCLLAPASLIDRRIQWEAIDDRQVKAVFTNEGQRITAILHFDEQGWLADFESDDRYAMSDKQRYRFSTPVHGTQALHGRKILSEGDAVWHYPEGAFTYGKFYLKDVIYNPSEVSR